MLLVDSQKHDAKQSRAVHHSNRNKNILNIQLESGRAQSHESALIKYDQVFCSKKS